MVVQRLLAGTAAVVLVGVLAACAPEPEPVEAEPQAAPLPAEDWHAAIERAEAARDQVKAVRDAEDVSAHLARIEELRAQFTTEFLR